MRRFHSGLFRDVSPADQPEGTYRYAMNAVLNRDLLCISNEGSNKENGLMPAQATVCGSVPLTDGRTVLFLSRAGESEIGIYVTGTYTTVLALPLSTTVDTDLGFDPLYPITGTFRQQGDGDVIIYFRSDSFRPRALNLTRQLLSPSDTIYGISPTGSPDPHFVDRLNLFPHSGPVPHITLRGVMSGGGCRTGSYQLGLAYEDEDSVRTDIVSVSGHVPIVDEPEGVSPIEAYDGAPAGTLSGKSILWDVSNLNTDMRYLYPAIIMTVNGAVSVVTLQRQEITSSTTTVSFSGEESSATDSVDILTENPEYVRAKAIEQLDSTLYLGNMTAAADLGFQKYANRISTTAVTHVFENFDPFMLSDSFLSRRESRQSVIDQGYRYPPNIDRYRSFMRDEVYALYISFILPSGKMSRAYHIPGRQPLRNIPRGQLEFLQDSPSAAPVSEDTQILWNIEDWEIIGLTGNPDPKGFPFQWYDFSHLLAYGSRNMNYWHNLNEFYPQTSDFIATDAQTQLAVEDMRGKNVRLHRFPGNRNPAMTTVRSSNATDVATGIQSKTKVKVHWYWYGGLEWESGEPIIHGVQPTEDWQAAQTLQDDLGDPMGIGCIADLTAPAEPPNSCYPPTSTSVPILVPTIAGCTVPAADIEFIYDTALQPNTQVIVAWDDAGAALAGGIWNLEDCCGHFALGTVDAVNGGEVTFSNWGSPDQWPDAGWATKGGWIMWAECEDVLDESTENVLSHEVQALGFKLSDLKIPQSIADQVQGFRIYYAKRTHQNRTILGQAPLHQMTDRYKMDLSGCDGGGNSTGYRDYWYPGGLPIPTNEEWGYLNSWSFYDFYLLNRRPSLAQATHVRLQYVLGMFNFKGHVEYYRDAQRTDLSDSENQIYSCWKPENITSFHLSGDHTRIQDSSRRLNWLLVDKSRTYVPGNTILEASHLGFGKPIYNIGGASHIALRTARYINTGLTYLATAATAPWREIRSDYSTVGFEGYSNDQVSAERSGCMLYLANLHAFKTDVYSPVDEQELVWTGYEVLGDEMRRFTVNENGDPIDPTNSFTTDDIFGGDTYICRYGYRMTGREEVNRVPDTWPNKGSIDHKSVICTIVESSENINFRHVEVNGEPYFPGASLKEVLRPKADIDLTDSSGQGVGKIKYNEDYSSVNDTRKVLPFRFQTPDPVRFPVRLIRSDRTTASLLTDNFRYFRPEQVRELNNRFGELWKISAMNNVLLYHMEDALFMSKGKQQMSVADGSSAYVGSGDIFEQEPDIVTHADGGYLGTRSALTCLVVPDGYFFADNLERKIFFLSKAGTEDLTSPKYGMSIWFRQNLGFALEQYGLKPMDSPVAGFGMHAIWDAALSRVLLTKRDLVPTEKFIEIWNGTFATMQEVTWSSMTGLATVHGRLWYRIGQTPGTSWTEMIPSELSSWNPGRIPLFTRTGWTLSFVPQPSDRGAGYWASFHDYVPYIYSLAGTDVLSFSDLNTDIQRKVWNHSSTGYGNFYGVQYPFTVDAPENAKRDSLFFNLSFLTEVSSQETLQRNRAGFTSFFAWSADAMTQETELEYLVNMRRVGTEWHVNDLRDMTAQFTSTDPYYTGPFTTGQYGIPGLPVTGSQNTGSEIRTQQPLLTIDGMYETQNAAALDLTKPWYRQGKFTGRYISVRLSCDNLDQDKVNLYALTSESRPQQR